MYTVTARDTLDSPEASVIEQFRTIEEAADYAGGLLDEIAFECQDERAALAPIFRALAEVMRRGVCAHAGVDGFEVRITTPNASDEFGEVSDRVAQMVPEEGNQFLAYMFAQADEFIGSWFAQQMKNWDRVMAR